MIDFDCRYVLDVPEYMKEAFWAGYLLDLVNTPTGVYARLVFVYPDVGVFDAALLLETGSGRPVTVSLLNLGCSFCAHDTHDVRGNAWLLYETGLAADAASGIAIALDIISRIHADGREFAYFKNIADFCGMSMSAEDFYEMYGYCDELPF